jgi:hypothetical protein
MTATGLEVVVGDEIERPISGDHIDKQIATAKRFPRSITVFTRECESMATETEEIAEECIYALPRDGKTIEGPSARLGEIVLSAWGNSAAGARVSHEDAQFVYAVGYFFDLQRNVRIEREIRRRIVDKNGRRFGPDMIAVTGNAACAIAQRNAVFVGIPKAFWISVYKKVRGVIAGDMQTLATRRAEVFAWMQKRGVDEARILHALGKVGVEDVGLDDFVSLKGMVNTIKEGEATVDELFPDPKAEERAKEKAAKKGVAGLKETMASKDEKKADGADGPTTPETGGEGRPEETVQG